MLERLQIFKQMKERIESLDRLNDKVHEVTMKALDSMDKQESAFTERLEAQRKAFDEKTEKERVQAAEQLKAAHLEASEELKRQRLQYENLLQQAKIEQKNLMDRLMFALGMPQVNNTIHLEQQTYKETHSPEPPSMVYPPATAAVLLAMKAEQDEIDARAKAVVEKQKANGKSHGLDLVEEMLSR
jgi:hypothetical protein